MGSEFVSGYVGGLAGVVVGHPFDTIKVYMQMKRCGLGAFETFKTITKQEGIQGLFKGMSSPLFGTAFLCSILFGVNGVCTKILPENLRNTAQGQFTTGTVAGLSQSLVTCPMELVKIRMQIKNIGSANVPRTTLIAQTRQIISETNGCRNLFKGMTATLFRDVPGFGLCFATNQIILSEYKRSSIERTFYNDMLWSFLAGGTAGVVSWIPSYPLDVIKTRIQSTKNPLADTKFIPFTRQLIKTEGFTVLTRGMPIQLARSFPVDAVMFCAAAMASRAIGSPSSFLL